MADIPPSAPPPQPTVADLKEAETAVRMMQQMLGHLHANKQGQGEVFREFMEHYKHLSTSLQEVRKIHQDSVSEQARLAKAAPRPVTGYPTALGRLTQPATRAQLGERRPAPPFPPAVPGEPAATLPPPVLPPARAAAPTEPPPPSPAVPVPASPEAVVAATVSLRETRLPAGLPLPLPRFASTLGPAGSRAISRGPEVQRLNQLLAILGYDVPQSEAFEVKTYRAVCEFQKAHALPANGVVGLETRRQLNPMVTG